MKLRAVTANEAKKLIIKGGYCWISDGEKTYYAANDDGEVYEYDTKEKRDRAVNRTRSVGVCSSVER